MTPPFIYVPLQSASGGGRILNIVRCYLLRTGGLISPTDRNVGYWGLKLSASQGFPLAKEVSFPKLLFSSESVDNQWLVNTELQGIISLLQELLSLKCFSSLVTHHGVSWCIPLMWSKMFNFSPSFILLPSLFYKRCSWVLSRVKLPVCKLVNLLGNQIKGQERENATLFLQWKMQPYFFKWPGLGDTHTSFIHFAMARASLRTTSRCKTTEKCTASLAHLYKREREQKSLPQWFQ